ncbi:DUF6319 family protein [Pseudonocardia alaniniphila]|uniref:DUF6319 family protein n=1 Tax=Pseudonocardia alaniniphila TaxID=75291 RepID=A0ABS9TJK7_9PSEU|nr:DUF6319 family protein [Pseudonocardia alaniniphila]MCH6168471.1 DUF6319 family protein [Pseudonocardia alaniniphila]
MSTPQATTAPRRSADSSAPETASEEPAAGPASESTPTESAAPAAAPASAPSDAPAAPEPADADAGGEKPRRGRPKGSSSARTTRTIELTLTVSGTADGDWQAELKQGTTWLSRGLPVTAAAVTRAAQELHEELAGPIEAVIGAAREQRAARVAALEAELEQARKALAEITD